MLSFCFVECLAFAEDWWLQYSPVHVWGVERFLQLKEHIHTSFDCGAIDHESITFGLDLHEHGRGEMVLYWWTNNVPYKQEQPFFPYLGDSSRLGVYAVLGHIRRRVYSCTSVSYHILQNVPQLRQA